MLRRGRSGYPQRTLDIVTGHNTQPWLVLGTIAPITALTLFVIPRFLLKLTPWLQRQTEGVANCYACDRLVSVAASTCIHCGTQQPGLWGYGRQYRQFRHQQGFVALVTWGCVALYALTLLVNLRGVRTALPFEILVPDLESLLMFGATGEIPLFTRGSWWTVFTAAWLHGHIFHLGFNLGWIRYLTPLVMEFYGAARMVVLYTGSAVTAALLSSLVAHYGTRLPQLLQGAYISVGASGALFGLFGALVAYGQQTGRKTLQNTIALYAGLGFILGFSFGSVDNWGHLGGFLGGFALSYVPSLRASQPQRLYDVILALVCLGVTGLGILLSVGHYWWLKGPLG